MTATQGGTKLSVSTICIIVLALYTVNHKNGSTLFIITLENLDRFL